MHGNQRTPLLLVGLLAAQGLASCARELPTALDASDPLAARGGGGGRTTTALTVSALDPDTVPADTALVIRVLGSGFTAGSQVSWELAGSPTTKVTTTGPATYVSSKELLAPVTVAADAPLTSYDVVVTAAGGKKGIGVELLEVVAKFNPLPEPSWAVRSKAYAVNGGGVIVGVAVTAGGESRAIRWTPLGDSWSFDDLGAGEAIGVNDDGLVAIRSYDAAAGGWRSSVLTPSGSRIELGLVWLQGVGSTGTLIGQVQQGSELRAVAWAPAGEGAWDGPVELPGSPNAQAIAVNGSDVIAGFLFGEYWDVDRRAVLWTPTAGGWSEPIAVDAGLGGHARAVTRRGSVAGGADPCASGCPSRPAHWAAPGAPRTLLADPLYGRVTDGRPTASVRGMNEREQIAGTALVPLPARGRGSVYVDHAVAWPHPSAEAYVDLGAGHGSWFSEAQAISDAGLVVGFYRLPSGEAHAVAWWLP